MISFDLACQSHDHRFEGWFRSSDDFTEQAEKGMIACPMCGDTQIDKKLSAPNVGRKGNQGAASLPAQRVEEPSAAEAKAPTTEAQQAVAKALSSLSPEQTEKLATMTQQLAEAQAKMLAKSEWVGSKLPQEARAVYYGDKEDRPMHGQATKEEIEALVDEGIELYPLPFPVVPDEAKN